MRIAIAGAAGRMGRMLLTEVHETDGAEIAGGLERAGTDGVGQDLGRLIGIDPVGVALSDDPDTVFANADVVIDFTVPAATVANLDHARRHGTAMVIGTTGMTAEDDAKINEAAHEITVMQAGNMSLGVNLLVQVTAQVAAALGIDWDVEVTEMHHRWKVDAPSGTALMLGKAAAEGRAQDHDAVAVGGRQGITGERQTGQIGYSALRGGNVVGEHSVVFASDNERVVLNHIANDRRIFAAGAVRAALWCADRSAGRYDMIDVLGLRGT